MEHVLITGGAGYIGSVLSTHLLDAGHRVTVLDRFLFGPTLAHLANHRHLTLVEGDIRSVSRSVLDGVDAVCDLAALSNDPAGELEPAETLSVNFEGRARICRLAREAGVRRYILASSCSLYGFQDGVVDEDSPINPLTTYARANALAEEATLAESGPRFTVTALRQATVYGLSPRMRFDLAINGMVLSLFRTGRIRVMRDGSQWRPMIHVTDTARAFRTVLTADPKTVAGRIFNVGSDDQNLQIGPLSERICRATGTAVVQDWYGDADTRSYRVAFRRARDELGFVTRTAPEEGAREIMAALRAHTVDTGPRTITVKWYRELGLGSVPGP